MYMHDETVWVWPDDAESIPDGSVELSVIPDVTADHQARIAAWLEECGYLPKAAPAAPPQQKYQLVTMLVPVGDTGHLPDGCLDGVPAGAYLNQTLFKGHGGIDDAVDCHKIALRRTIRDRGWPKMPPPQPATEPQEPEQPAGPDFARHMV